MAQSIFIPLTNKILLEYIYGEETNEQDFGFNDFKYIESPKFKQLLNPSQFEDGVSPEYTNNVRNRSSLQIQSQQSNKLVWTGIDGTDANTDWIANEGAGYDISLTNEFSINQTTDVDGNLENGVLYDRIKLHFVTGFTLDEKDGFVLNLSLKNDDDERIVLANHLFYRQLHNFELNPTPFIYNESLYDSFIELQVPNSVKLNQEYNRVENEFSTDVDKLNNSLLHRLSNSGLNKYNFVRVQFADLQRVEKVKALMRNHPEFVEESQDYLFLYTINSATATVPFTKRTANISVDIQESSEGDYFEFKGLYKNISIEKYINDLNLRGGNFILIYDVNVNEIVNTELVPTGSYTLYQTTNFSEPVVFRPVIKNGAATALSLTVNMRLYDRVSSTQFGRTGTITLTEAEDKIVQKYGPIQNVINLDGAWEDFNFESRKIYNLNPSAQIISLPDTLNDALIGSQVRYLHRFHDTYNLTFRQNNVLIDEEGKIATDDSTNITELFGQESAIVVLDPETNYLRLTFYDKTNNFYLRKNLSNRGQIQLRFGNKDSFASYDALELDNINKSNGELVFKIPETETDALREIQENNSAFRIVSLQGSERTVIYRGRFRFSDQETFENEIREEEQLQLSERIEDKEAKINQLNEKLDSLRNSKKRLESELSKSNVRLSELQELVNEYRESDDLSLLEDFIGTTSDEEKYKGPQSPNFEK